MKQSSLPRITILIVTLNNQRSISRCIREIRKQNYPRNLIEYLNVDGGSTDETVSILEKNGFRSLVSPIPRNAEAQRGVGLKEAAHTIVVSLDADNYLPHENWLRRMVEPFMHDPKIVHTGTLHFHYDASDAAFNRYNALFGAVDPIVFYIGRPDRLPQYVTRWQKGNVLTQTPAYTVVRFTKETLPTVGCNGVAYRKDFLLKYAQSDPEHFLHIDVFADLIDRGFDRFAVVNTDVTHDTAISLLFLMKKRIAFLSGYYLKTGIKRRYLIYNPERLSDKIRLMLFVVYTVTLIKPFLDALRGFLYIRDPAWFLHPVVCWVYLYAYAAASIKKRFSHS